MSTAILVPTLPLTTVTADDLLQQLISELTVQFTDWTDTQASNNMIMLLEVLSAIQELDFAYLNRQAREAFIQFALDYRNVVAHARSLSYSPGYQSASQVSAVITSASAVSANTTIPAGSQFQCVLSGVIYQTVADVVIPVGQTQSATVTLYQQVSCTDNNTGTGAPLQSFPLNQSPVIPDSLVMMIDGSVWQLVDNFVDSLSTDQVFTQTVDNNGVLTVLFGDGVSGKAVPKNAAITTTYYTGGGSANAIGVNGLGSCVSDVPDAGNGTLLSLSAYNAFPAVPGADAETTAQIRARAPVAVRSPRSLLTLDDVQNAVNALPGVLTCLAANWQTIPALPRYIIEIFVVPVGYGAPTDDLISDITDLVTNQKPMVVGQEPVVAGANYVTFNFNIQVFVLTGYNQNSVQNAMQSLIIALFSGTSTSFTPAFAMGVFNSVLASLLQQVPGVRNLVLSSPVDTQLSADQFPVLGTITFIPPA